MRASFIILSICFGFVVNAQTPTDTVSENSSKNTLVQSYCLIGLHKMPEVKVDIIVEERITIKGIVKNAYSGNPIANAKVLVKGGNGLGAITNADGEFSFSIAKGIYNTIKLEIAAEGYDSIVEYVNDIQSKKKVMLTVKMHKTQVPVALGNIVITSVTRYIPSRFELSTMHPLRDDVDIMIRHYFGISYWD